MSHLKPRQGTLVSYLAGLSGILGAAGLVVSQGGVMVNHPLTRTLHSFLHLVGVGGGLFMLIGLGAYTFRNFSKLFLPGVIGVLILAAGLILFVAGNFNYAILHGLLNLVSINDPIHQTPLELAPFLLSGGAFLIGLAALQNKTISLFVAILLMISAFIFGLGWLQIGDSMQRSRNLSRYLKAMLVVLPFGIAWFWLSLEQLRRNFNE